MIKRKLDKYIVDFYAQQKAALLLTGARQTGKTFAIRHYAEEQGMNLIEINFHEDESAKGIFQGAKDAEEILLRISAHTHRKTSLENTLIFFDEVQRCPDVITWIKFLVDHGQQRYALSGSLLGVELKDIRSVPVGYMGVKDVYPLDLEEFMRAVGISDEVLQSVRQAWEHRTPVDPVVHEALMRVVRLYLVVGGMPAAVQGYLDTNDLNVVEERQKYILSLYRWDISQYDPEHKLKIQEVYDLIPSELDAKNKRFILKNLNEHARFSTYEDSFLWLKNAGVAIPTYNITEPLLPLRINEQRNLFKLFLNDVGLLACQYASGLQLKLLQGDVNLNYGAIYENLVAQELLAHGFGGPDRSLHYFNSKRQGELDFVVEQNGTLVPLEVKSGKDYDRHQALKNVLQDRHYAIDQALVLCNENLTEADRICYIPVYMTLFLQKTPTPDKQLYHLEII